MSKAFDPDANLAAQLVAARRIVGGCPHETHEEMYNWYEYQADRLAGLVLDMDEALRNGKNLPSAWLLAFNKARLGVGDDIHP